MKRSVTPISPGRAVCTGDNVATYPLLIRLLDSRHFTPLGGTDGFLHTQKTCFNGKRHHVIEEFTFNKSDQCPDRILSRGDNIPFTSEEASERLQMHLPTGPTLSSAQTLRPRFFSLNPHTHPSRVNYVQT